VNRRGAVNRLCRLVVGLHRSTSLREEDAEQLRSPVEPLDREHDRLNSDLAPTRSQMRAFQLSRERSRETPADDLIILIVQQDDGAVPPITLPVENIAEPVLQIIRDRNAPLKGDVGEFHQPRQLANRAVLPLAVFDNVDF